MNRHYRLNSLLGISILLLTFYSTSECFTGTGLWGAKYASIPAIRKRIHFPLIRLPARSGYEFTKAQIVYIVHDDMFPRSPSRQSVCLHYTTKDHKADIALIEMKSIAVQIRHDNLQQAVSLGYFFNKPLPRGTTFRELTIRGTDVEIVAHFPGVSVDRASHLMDGIERSLRS
jgi:hypothetical protein